MELTRWMKIAKFQTFWIQMRKNKPLDDCHKTGQTSRTKMAFYSLLYLKRFPSHPAHNFFNMINIFLFLCFGISIIIPTNYKSQVYKLSII
ncbi:hypothetical protein Hanom_Chr12g01153391 [Helianthus anomalus]